MQCTNANTKPVAQIFAALKGVFKRDLRFIKRAFVDLRNFFKPLDFLSFEYFLN
jgi:hypothetical protein